MTKVLNDLAMSTRQSDQSSQEHFPPPPSAGIVVTTELETTFPASRVIAVADGHVVHTPSRPDYRDGNMIYLRRPPTPHDGWEWRAEEAMQEHSVGHVQIGWEEPFGTAPASLGKPFEVSRDLVLTREPEAIVATTNEPDGRRFQQLTSESDLDSLVELDVAVAADSGECTEFASWFAQQAAEWIRRDGVRWFGVKDDEQLVAAAGLAVTSKGLRFQEVKTHPQHRRRGWATRLMTSIIREASSAADQSTSDQPFVIVTEEHSHAEALYRKLGFTPASRLVTATAMNATRENSLPTAENVESVPFAEDSSPSIPSTPASQGC